MKKIFAMLAVAATLLAVSCAKDDNKGGSTKIDDQTQTGDLPAALQHSAFIPIVLDGVTFESIKSKVTVDLRVDDKTNNLWVWSGTYTPGDGAGLNFFGNTEGYVSLKVGTVGWSGAGFCVYNTFKPEGSEETFVAAKNPIAAIKSSIGAAPEDWVLHVAYKGNARVAHILGVDYSTGGKYSFAIGEGSLVDGGITYNAIAPKSGEFEAGEWMEYEIPVADLGIDFSADLPVAPYEEEGKTVYPGYNVLFCLSGATTGNEINLDAVYFYKK